MTPDLNTELQQFIDNIGKRNMYSGNKIPESIMRMFVVIEDDYHIGVEVPYWLSVLEYGRGPRKSTKDHKLYLKIKAWMRKRGMLKGKTAEAQDNEAKRMTWYINKYGNKQFNKGNPIYVDIYNSERKALIEKIDQKFSLFIGKITSDIL